MSAVRAPRWALSFADLCLLLLGFFVILHARQGDPARVTAGMRAAFGGESATAAETDFRATALFEPGEAVLNAAAQRWLVGLGGKAARGGETVLIVSDGIDHAGNRLDAWELAAARAAAVGRAVRAGGLADGRVTISIPSMSGDTREQRLRVMLTPAAK